MSNDSITIGESESPPDDVELRTDFIVGSELTRALHLLSVGRDATLFMTLQTALAILVYRHFGQEEIVFGIPTVNRIETSPLRLKLSGKPSFNELLAQAHRVVTSGQQKVPSNRIARGHNRGASRDHSALFHVMLAFDKEQSASSPLANAEIPPISVGLGAVPCDLILRARLHDGVIRAELESRSDTFDSSIRNIGLANPCETFFIFFID